MNKKEELPLFQKRDVENPCFDSSLQLPLFPLSHSQNAQKTFHLQPSRPVEQIFQELRSLLAHQKLDSLSYSRLVEQLPFPFPSFFQEKQNGCSLLASHSKEAWHWFVLYLTSFLVSPVRSPQSCLVLVPSDQEVFDLEATLCKWFPTKNHFRVETYFSFCFKEVLSENWQQKMVSPLEQELFFQEILSESSASFSGQEWREFHFLLRQDATEPSRVASSLRSKVENFSVLLEQWLQKNNQLKTEEVLSESVRRWVDFSGLKEKAMAPYSYCIALGNLSLSLAEKKLVQLLSNHSAFFSFFTSDPKEVPSSLSSVFILESPKKELSVQFVKTDSFSLEPLVQRLQGLQKKKSASILAETTVCLQESLSQKNFRKSLKKENLFWTEKDNEVSLDEKMVLSVLDFVRKSKGSFVHLRFLLQSHPHIKKATLVQILKFAEENEWHANKLIGQFDKITSIPTDQKILLGYFAECMIQISRCYRGNQKEFFVESLWRILQKASFFHHIVFSQKSKKRLRQLVEKEQNLASGIASICCRSFASFPFLSIKPESKFHITSFWDELPAHTRILFWPVFPSGLPKDETHWMDWLPPWILKRCEGLETIYFYGEEVLFPTSLLGNPIQEFSWKEAKQLFLL